MFWFCPRLGAVHFGVFANPVHVDLGHEELDRCNGDSGQPDAGYRVMCLRRGNARLKRVGHRYKPVDADRHVGWDAHCDREELQEEDDRAHRFGKDPRAQDDHREGERDAEDAHDEISYSQVDKERPDVRATPLAHDKHGNS